jgi:hypothetical protein
MAATDASGATPPDAESAAPMRKPVIALAGPSPAHRLPNGCSLIVYVQELLINMGHEVQVIAADQLSCMHMQTVCIPRRRMGVEGPGCVTFMDGESEHSYEWGHFRDHVLAAAAGGGGVVLLDIPLCGLTVLADVIDFTVVYGGLSADELGRRHIDSIGVSEWDVIQSYVVTDGSRDPTLGDFRWLRLYYEYVVRPSAWKALAAAHAAGVKMKDVNVNTTDAKNPRTPVQVIHEIFAAVIGCVRQRD